MSQIAVFAIYIVLAATPTVLSLSDGNLDPVPWFVVEKYQDDYSDSNVSETRYDTTITTPISPTNHQQSVNVCESKDCKVAAENFITNMDSTVDPCDDFFGYVCGGWPFAHPLPPTDSSWDQFSTRNRILSQQIREILEEEIDIGDIGPVKSAKRAYKACMNTDLIERRGIEPILSILDQNGGWPITMDASKRPNNKKFTWQQIEENYTRQYDTDSIYGITVDVDLKNASIYSIYIDQASTILPRSMITDDEHFSTLLNEYAKYVESVAVAFAEARRSLVPRDRIIKDARAIVNFETEIAKISSPDEMRRDFNRLYNLMSIRRLQKWYNRARPKTSNSMASRLIRRSGITVQKFFLVCDQGLENRHDRALLTPDEALMNWLKTIQNQFNEVKINVEATDSIVVMEMDYLFKLAKLLDRTPTRTIVNYVHWRMVSSLLPSTTKKMRDLAFQMEKIMFGVREQRDRWMACVADHEMRHAISYQYVKKFVTDVAKNSASKIVTEMQKEFEVQIAQSNWMDELTKVAAKEKLNSMKRFISHPDWYQNQTAMIYYYKTLIVTQDHFENTISFKRYDQRKKFRKYKTPVEQDVWTAAPITINAYYDPSMNSLTFPAGILQTPFFSPNVPDSLNYGSIGAVIGHEISHGFDDVGRQFDKNGNANQWWSDSTIKAFTERAQCFIDQYNNYTIQEISTPTNVYHANGELNQGENIADSTGLQASYEIFKRRLKQRSGEEPRLLGLESFTQDQLFFISYGNTWCETVTKEYLTFLVASDAHPTNRLRVLGALGNSEGFNKAFNCPVGSTMNREHKCNLWK